MSNVNSDKAYAFIRKRILDGEYPPGRALMTERLSEAIGVSRTPIRDALRQLESEGLVSIQARLGARVKKMDVKEFRAMCELRLALEGHAACLAALRRTETELREIQGALAAMRDLTRRIGAARQEGTLFAELTREDVRFHIAIISAARNELIKKEILQLHLIGRVVSGSSNPRLGQDTRTKAEKDARHRLVLAHHEEICDAIARADGPQAKAAMERHLQELIDHSLRAMGGDEPGRKVRELTPEELHYTA